MTDTSRPANLLAQREHLNEQQLRRLLVEHLTKQKLGLYWEASEGDNCDSLRLLSPEDVILVSINDENHARLEKLMGEVFLGMRQGTVTWCTQQGSNADQQCFLSVDYEHVLVYGNAGFSFYGFTKSYEMYDNADIDPCGDWRMLVINDDDSLGESVDLGDHLPVQEWSRETSLAVNN